MAPLKEFLSKTWELLDYLFCQRQLSTQWEDYRHVVDFVLNGLFSDKNNCPLVIKQWIAMVSGMEQWNSIECRQLEKVLNENKNYRAFRVATASITRPHECDSRVQDLLRFLMKVPRSKFVWYPLINSFFHNCEGSGRRSILKGLFKTHPTTRFEQLTFISVIAQLKAIPKTDPIGKSFVLDMATGQRVGWAVQMVLRGWDVLAKYFHFRSIEQMVIPYILFDDKQCQFIVIPTRNAGYLPKKNEKMLDFPLRPTTTTTETFKYAVELEDEVDTHLRNLASSCLEDCISVAADTELYALSNSDKWGRMEAFHVKENQLPSRFHQLPRHNMSKIRSSVAKLGLVGNIPPSSLVPQTAKLENIPVSFSLSDAVNPASSSFINTNVGTTSNIASSSDITSNPKPRSKRTIRASSSETEFEPRKKYQKSTSQESLVELLDIVNDFMSPFAKMHCCSFDDLPELHKLIELEDLNNSVQLLLTDPPYNVRRNRGMENSAYDIITWEEMRNVSTIAADLLREGGHGIIFCSQEQIELWKEALSIPEIMYDGHRDPTKTFAVDPTPLHIVRHPNYFSTSPSRSSCTLVNTVEYAIHFKKNGLPYSQEKTMVNYRPFNHIKSCFQGYRNVIDKVKGLAPGEQIRVSSTDSDNSKALRNEQKPVALLKELISRFSQPGDTVVDLFSGTFSTAVACFQLGEHRRFVGCEQDTSCFEAARDFVTKRFAESIVEKNSNIDATPLIRPKVEELVRRKLLKRVGDPKWYAPKGLPPFQRFPPQLVRFLSAMCRDMRLFTICAERPLHLWPLKYQNFMEQIDIDQALCHEAASQGLILDTCTSESENVYCFTARGFQAGDLICYSYGTIVYYKLDERSVSKKKYEEGILQVDQDTYKSFSIKLEIHGKKFEELERMSGDTQVSLVPAPFCLSRYIYNFNTCQGSSSTATQHDPNVSLVQTTSNLNHPNKLLPYNLFEIRAKKAIKSGVMLVLENKPTTEKAVVSDVIEID